MAAEDGSEAIALDAGFHDSLGRIGSNPIQAALLRVIFTPTLRARIWRQRLAVVSRACIRHEHQAIPDAIAARDVGGARGAMRQHTTQVILRLDGNPDSMAAGQTP